MIDVYHHESSKHLEKKKKKSIHSVMALNHVGLEQNEEWAQKMSEWKENTNKWVTIDSEAIWTQQSDWVKLPKSTLLDFISITKFKVPNTALIFSHYSPSTTMTVIRAAWSRMWFTPHGSLLVHLTLTGRVVMQ